MARASCSAGRRCRPPLPVAGGTPGRLATSLAARAGLTQRASPADLANALILAYCRVVTAERAVDPAQQRAWLLDFGIEVAETLQARAARGAD